MRPFQFHLKEHWRYPQLLDSLLPWTETISAQLDWWQNPTNMMRGADLHPKDHSIQLFTDASNGGWGTHLDQTSTKGLWSDRKKRLHINVLELKAVSLALRSFKDQCQNQTVLVATDHSTVVAYINKQGETHSAEMCALLWKIMVPSLSHNIKSQTHSRVPECDGRPSVQVEPSAVDRMVTASAGVQTDLSKVVHSSCRFATHLNHKLPLYVSPVPDPNAWDIDALNLNWMGLTAYAYPPWFWDLVQLSTKIPLQLPVSTTLLKQSHNYVFHSNPQHLNLHAWCLGVDSSKNKASLWRWQRELLPLRSHQQGQSISQNGLYLRNGAEKTQWISPLHL